ncbi:MAG TPA: S8 family serine peptidase [Streptosporangiaceae bacterium]|nr:S8 family serine peptidase [Streptosporangiaceae bacterium]
MTSEDGYLRGVRAVAVSLACLGVLTVVTLPVSAESPRVVVPAARSVPLVPTDSIRTSEWWLTAVKAAKAWRWSKGANVTVAVLDTGVDGHHPDLTGQVIQGPDYTGGGRAPGSRYWGRHGTAMATIIAGHGHGVGNGSGVLGIAPKVKILSIRVTWESDDPLRQNRTLVAQSRDAVANGIRYAVDHGAEVINMSIGGGVLLDGNQPVGADAVNYALSKGVVLVASMGNDGAGPNRKNFPAAYPGVIAVGAVDQKFKPWTDSNHQSYVSVAAPGKNIMGGDDIATKYANGTGTSPSSAMVAATAGLIRSRYPKLTPAQVRSAIEKGASHQPVGGQSDWLGAGVLDVPGAVVAAYKINKGGAGLNTPSATPVATQAPVAAPAPEKSLNLLLIAILAGGGGLVLAGLILGWLQRRRPDDESEPDPEPVPEEKVPVPVGAKEPTAKEPTMYAAPTSWQREDLTPPPPPAPPVEHSFKPFEVVQDGKGNGHRVDGPAVGDESPTGRLVAFDPLNDPLPMAGTQQPEPLGEQPPRQDAGGDDEEFRPPWW